jgi:hypothetical protein
VAEHRRPEIASGTAAGAPGSVPPHAIATIRLSDSDPDGGQATQVRDEPVVIGRAATCDLVLTNAAVSRRHAMIRVRGDGFELEDLGSGNGTWLNDERLTEAVSIGDGDRIRVADVELVFVVPAVPAPTGWSPQPPRRTDGRAGGPTEPLTATASSSSEGSLASRVVASDGFSGNALGLAVLGSVVGTILTASIGTGRWGVLVAAVIGPVLSATFTTRRAGERGRVRLGAIVALSALALIISITGFALTPAEVKEPLVGDADPSATVAQMLPSTGRTTDPQPPPPSSGPSAPTGLSAEPTDTTGEVALSWTQDETVDSFTVIRVVLPDGIETTTVADVPGGSLSTTDFPPPEGTYRYHVSATDSAQQVSDLSVPACVTVAVDGTVTEASCE